ncbi:MAG: IS66 family insertion sequence element accessory protein TnpA [Verrucomicrobiales bacterium]
MSNRYSEKEKLRLVSGWVESGESRASYAKRHGISAGSLARWEAELGPAVEGGGVRFVEVEVPSMPAEEGSKPVAAGVVVAELVLPGGACVRSFSREGAC